ncbi:MAG: histidine phosphatase family protein [Silicimonas sp.]|nr:histidine phosphatase family protein [Silicimonas sp.]
MTLTLICTRHAKSDWDDPLQDDVDRPLSARGKAAAPLLGQWLADKGHIPELALVSSAARTIETWALMSTHLKGVAEEFLPGLYLATPDVMRRTLMGRKALSILLIAHNPGMADLTDKLVAQRPDHPKFRMYPTGATTVIQFDTNDWANLGWRQGKVLDFIVPRDLS